MSSDAAMIRRIQGLERQMRTMKIALLALLSLLSVVSLLGFARSTGRIVEAEQFILRDSTGQKRASLGTDPTSSPTGLPLMRFYDDEGTVRLALGLEGNPELVLYDPRGRVRLLLGTDVTGAPSVALREKNAQGGVYLYSADNGTSNLVFVDKQSHGRAELLMGGSDGASSLKFTNGDGKTALTLASGEGAPVISTGIPNQVTKRVPRVR